MLDIHLYDVDRASLGRAQERWNEVATASTLHRVSLHQSLQGIPARVDLAITQGKVSLADRASEVTALENSTTLDASLTALDARAKKFPTASDLDGSRKNTAGATSASLALGNAMEVHVKTGKTKSQALDLVMKNEPALYEAYRKEGGAL